MKYRFIKTLLLLTSSSFLLASCGEDTTAFETPNTGDITANAGIVSQKNFSLLTSDVNPAVIDGTTNVFTKTDVELTAYIGDRNNQTLTDEHTIYFVAEYGLIEPSCVTEDGSCSVTWSAIKRPDAGGPGSDFVISITAYTLGEEGFTDTNGNGAYDDGDSAFDDLEEPFIDTDEDGVFSTGDIIIDVVSTNDPSGANGVHDIADGFYNGASCQHTVLCGDSKTVTIFDSISMPIVVNSTTEFSIGGVIIMPAGAVVGDTVTIQNNGGDDITVTGTDSSFTFSTLLSDGVDYTVSVDGGSLTGVLTGCSLTNETGTISGADVTDVILTCTD